MKKILITIPSIKIGGGAENVATNIGNELHKKGYIIYYLTFYEEKNKLKINGRYFSLNEKISNNIFINFLKLFSRAKKISNYCIKNNIDISISHLDEANFSNILSKIFFGNKSKIIIEIHNSINKSLNKIYLLIYKLIIKYSDKIVSLTKEDLINYKKIFRINKKNIINIYNPINIDEINQLKNEIIEEKEIFNKNNFNLINIGRLTTQKNQELLIKAINILNKKYKNITLIILGEGELKEKLYRLKGKNKNIIFLGKKNNPYKYLKKSDFLIMTSNFEGLPVTQIEALACNTPIISSNCETGPIEIINIKEKNNYYRKKSIIIGDCGILFPTGDINKLIKSIELIYKEKQLQIQFKNNIKIKQQEFYLNNIIKKWIQIIEE